MTDTAIVYDTAEPAVVRNNGFMAWLRRTASSAWSKIKGAWRATKGFFARLARGTWSRVKVVVKPVGTWTMKGLGWTGSVITGIPMYVVKTGMFVITAGGGLMLLGIGTVTNMWRDHVYDRFGWLRYRADHKVSFKEYRIMRKADRKEALDRALTRLENMADRLDPESVNRDYQLDDDVIVYDPDTVEQSVVTTALRDKVALRVQADLDDESDSFPGARVSQVASADPYTAVGSTYEPENTVLEIMNRWLSGGDGTRTAVQFSFDHLWSISDQIDAVTFLKEQARTAEEASFWEGRFQALVRYQNGSLDLDNHGRAWALVNMHYRNSRKLKVSMIRTGFMDMVNDLKKQRDTRERNERSQAVATGRP